MHRPGDKANATESEIERQHHALAGQAHQMDAAHQIKQAVPLDGVQNSNKRPNSI